MKRSRQNAALATVEKAARKPAAVPGKPFEKGDKRINRTKPGPGRPKNEFKAWCAEVLNDDATREEVEKIMDDGDHRAFKPMFSELADRAYGKANQNLLLGASESLQSIMDAVNAMDRPTQ